MKYNKEFDLGNGEYNVSVYCDYFVENLQDMLICENRIIGNHMSIELFEKLYPQSLIEFELQKLDNDSNLLEKIDKLKDIGINLDLANFYVLCRYINAIIRNDCYVLLKPTIKDTLSELDDIVEISFKNKNGQVVTSTNSVLVEQLIETTKQIKDDGRYETYKIARIDKAGLVNNRLLQIRFVYLMTAFLQAYFKDAHRRSNAMLDTKEQNLIMKMMVKMELSSVELNEDSYRKIVSEAGKIRNYNDNIDHLTKEGLTYIKYEDWHNRKKSDWNSPNIKLHPISDEETVILDPLKYPQL
jgi:hypothetical protein